MKSILVAFLCLFILNPVVAQDTVQNRGLIIKKQAGDGNDLEYYQNHYAVIVGIDDYQKNEFSDLNYATADARSIKDLLVRKFNYKEKNVKLLLNEDATKYNILSSLSALKDIERNSQVLFYFAGHGQTLQLASGGEMGILVTHDASNEDLYVTGLRMKELSDVTNLVAGKHQLYMVDACYGGLAAVTNRGGDKQRKRYLNSLLRADARQIITAGGKDEQVIEKAVWGHSAFAKVLLDGLGKELADTDQNRLITATELSSYMKSQVFAHSGGRQKPVYRRFTPDEGDFVFNLEQSNQRESRIVFNSTPSKAEVFIDGQKIGTTPVSYETAYGTKNIRISKDGFVDYSEKVDISNPDSTIYPTLDRVQSKVFISSNVTNADIFIDGRKVGTTPMSYETTYGSKQLTIRKERFNEHSQKINITSPDSSIHAVLSKARSQLSFSSNVSEANVFVNGRKVGVTPVTYETTYGPKELKVTKQGYHDFVQKINVSTPDSIINAKLNKAYSQVTISSNVAEAKVVIDGENVGITPYSGSIETGSVELVVKKSGYLPYKEYVLFSDSTEKMDIELERAASFSITSSPSEAKVFVNDSLRGDTPFKIQETDPDVYQIRLVKDGYPDVKKELDLENNYHKELNINLRDHLGSLQLIGIEADADVEITGNHLYESSDKLPATVEYLRPGTYSVSIKKKGFKSVKKTIRIDDQQEKINVINELEPKSKFASVVWSLFIPGGGQFHMGKTGRGALFLIAGAASAGYTVKSTIDFMNRADTYENARAEYNSAVSGFDHKYEIMQEAYEERKAAKDNLMLGAGIFLGVKGLELLDNLLFRSPKKRLEKAKIEFEAKSNAVGMRINF
ncbi:PEGA domain-containing protein [Fodinibius halophilus]|uniref:PEGA domain-containing protein n=1 Tax=Fodinibius halophilus TaxID=1736908 RepID=A0A6M1TB82_9BACT|nr:PEGA domain-containing protein [Fodinibius halophilus]NGP89673.1 PEGA domain-containing protein [Fodinibius halophilus]